MQKKQGEDDILSSVQAWISKVVQIVTETTANIVNKKERKKFLGSSGSFRSHSEPKTVRI